jgi:hypothetical protein
LVRNFAPEVLAMSSTFWPRVSLALAVSVGLGCLIWSGGEAAAYQEKKEKDKDDKFKKVTFETYDSVKIAGDFYGKPDGKKDAVVLLLPNFDHKKGGDRHQDNMPQLAETLNEAGYAVLLMDWRGHGGSKSVGGEFWNRNKNPHNRVLPGASKSPAPESIDQKDFPASYYWYLVNDVAAAKAYLDRQNDNGQCNSSNLILIGAGEGALIGQVWLATEWRRRKQLPGPGPAPNQPNLAEPEGNDCAGAVWLSISPSLVGHKVERLRQFTVEVGAEHKMPMCFIYGDGDKKSKETAETFKKAIMDSPLVKKEKLEFTGVKEIKDTELSGSQLLQGSLETEKWILKEYLDKLMEKRGSREQKKREAEKSNYFWAIPTQPGVASSPVKTSPAKLEKEDVCRPIPLQFFGISP